MAAAASIDPAAALMLRIAGVSGARRAELAALQWADLNDGMPTIDSAIEYASSGDGIREFRDAATKTANTRTVTLDPDTVAAIEALRRGREPYDPWMFGLGRELVSPDRIRWWWKRARKISGIDEKWRLHDLRHWSATLAIGQGHDVRTVAGRLGPRQPGDSAVVVCGGLLSSKSVQRTVERCRREYGFLGLSVYGAIGITVDAP